MTSEHQSCVRCGQFIHRYDTDGDSTRGAVMDKAGGWWCHPCAVAEIDRWLSAFGERAESPAPPDRGETD